MSSKTKIIVLHMKEIIYTGIFLILGILLVFLLFFMFHSDEAIPTSTYQPGIYTSTISLSNATLEVEVTVDENQITGICFTNLDEAITTSYPLIEPAMEELTAQIIDSQSLEGLTYSTDSQYTSQVIVDAISLALEKAGTSN